MKNPKNYLTKTPMHLDGYLQLKMKFLHIQDLCTLLLKSLCTTEQIKKIRQITPKEITTANYEKILFTVPLNEEMYGSVILNAPDVSPSSGQIDENMLEKISAIEDKYKFTEADEKKLEESINRQFDEAEKAYYESQKKVAHHEIESTKNVGIEIMNTSATDQAFPLNQSKNSDEYNHSQLVSYIKTIKNNLINENIFLSFFRGVIGFSRTVKGNAALKFRDFIESDSKSVDINDVLDKFSVEEILALRQGELGKIINTFRKDLAYTDKRKLFEKHENKLLNGISTRCVALGHR